MASELRVNKLTNRSGLGTVTYTDTGAIVSGITTASNFKTGTTNVHSTGVELANINTGGSTATFGGDLSIPDTIVHTGDTNTKIRFPSADTFAVDTGGTERLRITSGGEVKIMNTSGTVGLYFQSSSGAVSNFRAIGTNNQSLGYFFGNDEKVRFGSNGNVGINSTAPTGKFDIALGANSFAKFGQDADNPKMEMFRSTGNASNTHYGAELQLLTGDFVFSNAPGADLGSHSYTERVRITSAGRVGIGTDIPAKHFVVVDNTGSGIGVIGNNAGIYMGTHHTGGFQVNAAIARAASNNYHITNSVAGDLCIASESTKDMLFGTGPSAGAMHERLRINSAGKVGINTASPAHHLDVVGNLRVHGQTPALYLTTHANTAESAVIRFGDTGSFQRGSIQYDFAGNSHLRFKMGGAGNNIERLNIEGSSGNLTNTGSATSYVTTQFAANFAKIDLRGTNIANSNHYILSYGEGHANDHEFHMVNTIGHLIFRTGTGGNTQRVRINNLGEMSIGGQHASSAYDPNSYGNPSLLIAGDDNADILTLMNDDPTPNNGDYASLGFRVAGQSTGSYSKAAIMAVRNGGYNALDLVFAIGTDADATRTTTSHERFRINPNGRIGISHNLAGTADYNRLMIHNPHSGSCWLQMTSTASGSAANTDGFSLGMNTSNIAHIWLRENAKMQFATNGSARAEITAQGTLVAGIVGTIPVNQAEAGHHGGTGFSAGNAMGLMVKRSVCISDSAKKGQGAILISHTRNIACDGTTYNFFQLYNREGCFIGDVYVGWSGSGAAAVKHYKFHTYYAAHSITTVNSPSGRSGGDSISVQISSSNDAHTFQCIPNKSNNGTEYVTMTIIGLSAGTGAGDYYTCTYN